ncbi:hypothetical protein CKAH01_13731 [Colletotrichum kahawae]|uniref:Uncharacterized protein n=1 Tax=Colletotrichum kahawae TaxID=34407 RepID=A0AAD9YP83_COLKA|nr:hypothetical protein CKAH01_13731 [Colletotrichum kahawae]
MAVTVTRGHDTNCRFPLPSFWASGQWENVGVVEDTSFSQRNRPIKQTADGDIGTELTNGGQWTAMNCEAMPCRRCATQHTWWTAAYCKRPSFLDGGRMTADEGFVTGNVDNVQLAEKGRQMAGKCWLPDVIRRIEVQRAPLPPPKRLRSIRSAPQLSPPSISAILALHLLISPHLIRHFMQTSPRAFGVRLIWLHASGSNSPTGRYLTAALHLMPPPGRTCDPRPQTVHRHGKPCSFRANDTLHESKFCNIKNSAAARLLLAPPVPTPNMTSDIQTSIASFAHRNIPTRNQRVGHLPPIQIRKPSHLALPKR